MSLLEFLRLIRERWLPIVLCVVLGLAASAIGYLRTPPQYTATVTLFMSAPVPFNNPAAAYASAQEAGDRADAYTQLLNSERLAQNVISSLGLDESPADLASSIGTSHQQKSVVIQASVTRNDPDQAALLANAVADSFIRLVGENEQTMDPKQPEHVDAHVVQPATRPSAPQSPKLLVNLALGLVLGLLVGIGVEFFRRILDVRVRSEERLAEVVGVESLGSLPHDPAAAGRPLDLDRQPRTPLAEAMRKIRIKLPPRSDDGARVIAVTSAAPREGRTLFTVNLATAIAETGSRVLVVEGDLRGPRLSEYLGLPDGRGLSDILRAGGPAVGDTPLRRVGDVDVITAGTVEPNPSRLLSSHRMSQLVAELRREYDYVLIDTPPVLPVVDAALVMAHTDGVILVVRSGRTSAGDVAAAASAIHDAGGCLLGGVLSADRSRFTAGVRAFLERDEITAPDGAGSAPPAASGTPVEPVGSTARVRPPAAPVPYAAPAVAAPATPPDNGVARGPRSGIENVRRARPVMVDSPTVPHLPAVAAKPRKAEDKAPDLDAPTTRLVGPAASRSAGEPAARGVGAGSAGAEPSTGPADPDEGARPAEVAGEPGPAAADDDPDTSESTDVDGPVETADGPGSGPVGDDADPAGPADGDEPAAPTGGAAPTPPVQRAGEEAASADQPDQEPAAEATPEPAPGGEDPTEREGSAADAPANRGTTSPAVRPGLSWAMARGNGGGAAMTAAPSKTFTDPGRREDPN